MNEWVYSSGSACYASSDEGYAITQSNVLAVGKLYGIYVTVSGMTQGKLILDSLEGKPEIIEDGDYTIFGIATQEDFILIGGSLSGSVFNGCIDGVGVRLVPYYEIKDVTGNVVFSQTDETGVTAELNNIQYLIDWSSIDEGCYTIAFSDGIIDYESESFYVKASHSGTIQLTWTNEENAYGFDYANLSFTPSLRIKGKKWHPKYPKEKEVFKDSIGNRTIIRSDTSKVEILTVNEVPEYVHDALSIGIEHDTLEIDGVKYVSEETDYGPKWRNSSNLASVDIEVIKASQNLINENCA